MTTHELFHAGRLKEAVDAQIQKIKNQPADKAARLFLVELLLFQGDLDRAKKHLDLLNYDSPEAQSGLELYRRAWDAEVERRQVLAGKSQPFGLIDSPEHISLRLQALEQYSQGHTAEGNALVDQANNCMPATAFTVDGQRVLSLRDSDDLLAGVLEVYARGRYCWVPWEQVEKLQLAESKTPRDVLYIPAHLTMRGSTEGDVLVPGIYADSYLQVDEDIRLGRATDWLGGDEAPLRGVGGKTLFLEDQTKPLLHIREVVATAAAS
ncbi:MAG: type VI secretion system accessory protein TagJ [Gemmatales bacterium]